MFIYRYMTYLVFSLALIYNQTCKNDVKCCVKTHSWLCGLSETAPTVLVKPHLCNSTSDCSLVFL